jgi:rare lipoprotein A
MTIPRARLARAVCVLSVAGCACLLPAVSASLASERAGAPGRATAATSRDRNRHIIGHASWYGRQFANRPTASGELFDPEKLTAAHRRLPLGSKVVVTNLHNGRSVLLTITDRGPYWPNRDIDVSYRAARVLGMVRRGVARVRIDPL